MLFTFKYFHARLLQEDRVDYAKTQHRDLDPEVIDHLAKHFDPTRDKRYTNWLARSHKNGDFGLHEHDRVSAALRQFDAYKGRMPVKDIMQHKTLGSVENMHPDAPMVHSIGGVTVHHLASFDAAKKYGKGSEWCTSSKEEQFDDHNKDGNIYLIHTPDGKRYQFHSATAQLMDNQDNEVSPSALTSRHPQLKDMHALKDMSGPLGLHFMHDHEIDAQKHELMNHHDENFRAEIAGIRPGWAGQMKADKSPYVRQAVAMHHEHAESMMNDEHPDVRATVARLHGDLAHRLVEDPESMVRYHAMKHRDVAAANINHNNSDVRLDAAWHHEDLAHQLSSDGDDYVRGTAAKHRSVAVKLLGDHSPEVRRRIALAHPDLGHHLLGDKDRGVQFALAKHRVNAEKMLDHHDPQVRQEIAWNHKDLQHHFVADPHPDVRATVAQHSEEHAHKLVDDPVDYVRDAARRTMVYSQQPFETREH